MKYSVIFDFTTFIDVNMEDEEVILNHVPSKDIEYYIKNVYYKVEDIEYLLDEDVFVVALSYLGGI